MAMCVESLEDGAIEPGPEAWQILSDQIGRISRLADDVGQVSAAEEGRLDLARRPVGAHDLAATAVLAARDGYDRKGVNLVLGPGIDPDPVIDADPVRCAETANKLADELEARIERGEGVVPAGTKRILITGTPLAMASSEIIARRSRSATSAIGASLKIENASVCRASPARMAFASPNLIWQVG